MTSTHTEPPSLPDQDMRLSGPLPVALMSVAFTVLLVGTWVFSDLTVRRAGPYVTAAGRSFFSCVGLCLLTLRSKGALRRSVRQIRTRPLALAVSGLVGVSIYAASSLLAIDRLGISLPNLLLATGPCLSLLIGVAWFGRRTTRWAVIGVLVAALGAGLRVLATFQLESRSTAAVVVGVVGGVVAVAAISFYGQHYATLSRGHDPLDLLPGIFGVGTVILLVLLALTGRLGALLRVDLTTIGLLVLLGVVIYVPVYVLQHTLIHVRGAVFMASISLMTPFGVQFVDAEWLGAPAPTWWEVGAGLVCLLGVALVVRFGAERPRPAPHADRS